MVRSGSARHLLKVGIRSEDDEQDVKFRTEPGDRIHFAYI
jgi:hypothetical protein